MPTVEHLNHVYANNRAEGSHQPTRQREYHMRGFASSTQAQRFLTLHGLTQNLFRLGATSCRRSITVCCGLRRFRFGRKRCVHKGLCEAVSLRPSAVKLTIPLLRLWLCSIRSIQSAPNPGANSGKLLFREPVDMPLTNCGLM